MCARPAVPPRVIFIPLLIAHAFLVGGAVECDPHVPFRDSDVFFRLQKRIMAKRSDVPQEDHLGPVKKPKRECKYQSEWRKNGVLPSRKGPTFALCESCGVDINIGHGGLNDVRKHIATSKH